MLVFTTSNNFLVVVYCSSKSNILFSLLSKHCTFSSVIKVLVFSIFQLRLVFSYLWKSYFHLYFIIKSLTIRPNKHFYFELSKIKLSYI